MKASVEVLFGTTLHSQIFVDAVMGEQPTLDVLIVVAVMGDPLALDVLIVVAVKQLALYTFPSQWELEHDSGPKKPQKSLYQKGYPLEVPTRVSVEELVSYSERPFP